MDDDIVIEPDSILRAVAFSRFARRPMLVGGQMLDLQVRSRLHSMGEVVDPRAFTWRDAPRSSRRPRLRRRAVAPADSSVDLHRRVDVDYNGWWMCLIPRAVAAGLGLPLPLFIKWDDAEYGLRAAAAGYPTASLPGVAVWHLPWSDKDDTTDWQAYFHLRNRLVVAAMHGTRPVGRPDASTACAARAKHLLSLEYSTVALQERAVEDFRAGPAHLFDLLAGRAAGRPQERTGFTDGRVLPSAGGSACPRWTRTRRTPAAPAGHPWSPGPPRWPAVSCATCAGAVPAPRRPQLNVAARDARWYLLSRIDGATVATSDGRGVAYRKRDPGRSGGCSAVPWRRTRAWRPNGRACAARTVTARRGPRVRNGVDAGCSTLSVPGADSRRSGRCRAAGPRARPARARSSPRWTSRSPRDRLDLALADQVGQPGRQFGHGVGRNGDQQRISARWPGATRGLASVSLMTSTSAADRSDGKSGSLPAQRHSADQGIAPRA